MFIIIKVKSGRSLCTGAPVVESSRWCAPLFLGRISPRIPWIALPVWSRGRVIQLYFTGLGSPQRLDALGFSIDSDVARIS